MSIHGCKQTRKAVPIVAAVCGSTILMYLHRQTMYHFVIFCISKCYLPAVWKILARVYMAAFNSPSPIRSSELFAFFFLPPLAQIYRGGTYLIHICACQSIFMSLPTSIKNIKNNQGIWFKLFDESVSLVFCDFAISSLHEQNL